MIQKERMTKAICKELTMRKDEIHDQNIETIYFGGGTPSVLDMYELQAIMNVIQKYYNTTGLIEVTFECNPDDLNREYLCLLKSTGINRLSIGVQSFHEQDLLWMNRAHNALQSHKAIEDAIVQGFEDITIDLIYGVPAMTDSAFIENIKMAVQYNITHISVYALTIEEKTAFGNWIAKGKMPPLDESKASNQFDILIDVLAQHNYLHYEISNFAKANHEAKHNTNYWRGVQYIGVGPSAHSYNGSIRSWNISHNAKYIEHIEQNVLPHEKETLSINDRYNEYIMTGLRTMWGVNLNYVETRFGHPYAEHLVSLLDDEFIIPLIIQDGNTITLNKAGKHYADKIAATLFFVE